MAKAKPPEVEIAANDGYVVWVRLDTNPGNWLRYVWGCKTPADAARVVADLVTGNRQIVESKVLFHDEVPVSGPPPQLRMSGSTEQTQGGDDGDDTEGDSAD